MSEVTETEILEKAAQHFDDLAAKSESLFAVTTTHREICRAAAKELRDYARRALSAQPKDKP